MHVPVAEALARLVVESGAAHGTAPMHEVQPWPQTLMAVDIAEAMLAGDESQVTEATWSPNMDIDVPRDERRAALAVVRAAIGESERVAGSLAHPTPARATWLVRGPGGSAKLDVLLTPERTPRIQKLTVTRSDG